MMEFGEAVLFSKFLREHSKMSTRHALVIKHKTIKDLQQEEPGLWFKWLAYRAATLQERRK